MRSIILSVALAALAAAGAPAAPWTGAPAPGARCPDEPTAHLARPGSGAEHRKLTDLPPAEGYLAVFQRDADGCIVPVKVDFRPDRPRRR